MIKLYKPKNEVEVALIKSIFDSENISYFIHNENFGSLEIGPQIDMFNSRIIMIHEEDFEKANELLSDFLNKINENEDSPESSYSRLEKVRLFFETILFG